MASRWYRFFEYCEDTLGLCATNSGAIANLAGGDLREGLANGEEVYFSIMRTVEQDIIPKNYFCKWEIDIELTYDYQMSIKRNFFPVKE